MKFLRFFILVIPALFSSKFAYSVADCLIPVGDVTYSSDCADILFLSNNSKSSNTFEIETGVQITGEDNWRGAQTAIYLEDSSIGVILNDGRIIAGINDPAISLDNSTFTTFNITGSGNVESRNGDNIEMSNGSTISTFINSGTMQINGSGVGYNITAADSTITTFTNSGTIETIDGSNLYLITGTINTFTNSGDMTATGAGTNLYFDANSVISSLTNSGNITSQTGKVLQNTNSSVITTFTNTSDGTISSFDEAIDNSATINYLINAGSISNTNSASSAIANNDTILELTNTGTISGGNYDIENNGSITTLNNSQGEGDPLKFTGVTPENYNIIINSTTSFGQVEFDSPVVLTPIAFGIHTTSSISEDTTYSAVFSGLAIEDISATSGSSTLNGITYTWSLINSSATSWDLVIDELPGPSAADTQTSIQAIKAQLQGNLNSLTAGANFANMNTYDCNFFDAKGGCFSFGNRYTDVHSPSMQTNSFVATGGYKINDHFRVAGFIDQNLNYNLAHNIDVENKGPLVGLIGVWNQNANQLGWQVKVANAYQSKDASIKRSVTGTSEAGTGKTDIDVQSYVAELSYNHAINSSLLLRPYMALRYALVKQDGYTETGVDNPLTYNTIRDRSKTALVGVKVKKQLTDKVVARGSVGLEHDLSHKTDNLEASGVSGLTSESFSNKLDKTRPVASLGADYYIDQTQRLSVNAFYQELPFVSTKSRTLYINYMLGF